MSPIIVRVDILNEGLARWTCPLCDKWFYSWLSFKRHIVGCSKGQYEPITILQERTPSHDKK